VTVEPISRRAEVVLAGYVCPGRKYNERGVFDAIEGIVQRRPSTLLASAVSAMKWNENDQQCQ
jgi:hypothetical protein